MLRPFAVTLFAGLTVLGCRSTDPSEAASHAIEACRLGDTGGSNVEGYRRALKLEGVEVSGMSVNEVLARWQQFEAELPDGGLDDEVLRRGTADQYRAAASSSKVAAAMDTRYEDLHRNMASYRDYMSDEGAAGPPSRALRWFEGIREECDRVLGDP